MDQAKAGSAAVLIVDDEVPNTCSLSNFLNRIGYRNVETLNDPTAIFEKLETFQPDLILLDLAMPNIDGFQLLEMLRKRDSSTGRVPIIVITGEATPANKRKALAAGATDLLAKPIDPAEANTRIRNTLDSYFLQLQIEEQNRVLDERVAERTRQLQNALDQLQATQRQMLEQERLSAFAQMAAGVVHDFSNTLMSIIGYSEMLVSGDGQLLANRATALEYLRIINTAGRDAAEIVSRLRDFYRPREQADILQRVDLNQIVQQAMLLTQPKWRTRRVNVEVETSHVPQINGHASELREMLTNLIFNATDATSEGGVITIRTIKAEAAVAIEVQDNGCGMSAEVRARCLEPFFSTKGDKGTGLGLPMVFGIVERHQGKLEIESAEGSGTTFRITLPMAGARAVPESIAA